MTERPVVLVTETLGEPQAAWLAERAEVRWVPHDDPDALDAAAPSRRTAWWCGRTPKWTRPCLNGHPKLKVVGRAGVGLDNIDTAACDAREVAVVYTPDANTQAVVEYVLGLMLDRYRPRTTLPAQADAGTFHELRKTEVGTQLDTLTLGIVGFGRIGRKLGQVAHALGINLLVTDVLPEPRLRKQWSTRLRSFRTIGCTPRATSSRCTSTAGRATGR